VAKCREAGWALTSPKTGEPMEAFWLPNKVVCIQVVEWVEGKRRRGAGRWGRWRSRIRVFVIGWLRVDDADR
jgi:hypothetical protein